MLVVVEGLVNRDDLGRIEFTTEVLGKNNIKGDLTSRKTQQIYTKEIFVEF